MKKSPKDNEYMRKYMSKYSKKEKYQKNQKEWHKNNLPNRKQYNENLKNSVIEALGGKCRKCGFSDKRVLQIDHIHGGGKEDRKGTNYVNFRQGVLKSFTNGENKYQLLCANCNWIKRFENNES